METISAGICYNKGKASYEEIRMKRRNLGLLFAILLLALINLSPSASSNITDLEDRREIHPVTVPDQKTEQESSRIKVGVIMQEEEFQHLQQMNREFMAEHPIQVELLNIPSEEAYSALQVQLQLGDAPDVILLDNVWIRRLSTLGYLLPTESYYTRSLTGEVVSASLSQNEWNGFVWGVPVDIDPYVFVYDPLNLQELGINQFPNSPEEWNDLIQVFQSQTQIPYLFAFDYDDPYTVLSLLWQLGGRSDEPDSVKGPSRFEPNVELEAMVQRLTTLLPVSFNLGQSGEMLFGVESKLLSGEALITVIPSSAVKKKKYSRMEVTFPTQESLRSSLWINGRSYVVSSQTDHKEAVGTWISAMTSSIYQREWYEVTGYFPVMKTMYYERSSNLPEWTPFSLVQGAGEDLPADSELPYQMDQFGEVSGNFLNGDLDAEHYLEQLRQIFAKP